MINTYSNPTDLKITDMRFVDIDGAPKRCTILKIMTNQGITGYGEYYGMVAGIKAGNNDVTHIFGDATLRIGERDFDKLAAFLERVSAISDVEFIFTVSADKAELPGKIFDIAEVC